MKVRLFFMNFSDKLRHLVEERNITQKQLANELHIPVSTFGGYVQGTSEPDFQTLRIIANYFNVSTDYLLDMPCGNSENSMEADLLRIFRSLTPEQQVIFLEQGKAFSKVNLKKNAKSLKSIS